jgi:methionine aminopeptidase
VHDANGNAKIRGFPARERVHFPSMLVTKPADIEGATKAAECVVKTPERLVEYLREGQTLAEIDAFVGKTLKDLDAPSCFVGYKIRGHPPFPSHAC